LKNINSVKVVSDGSYLLDGGPFFGPVPKILWEKQAKPDRKNRVRLGLNSLLIKSGEENILVNTGIGSKEPEINREIYGHASSRLIRNLKNNGVSAKDISKVVLTQLHFDHSGGSTSLDREGKLIPTFPKAKYLVQKSAWDEAFDQDERLLPAYGHPVDHLNILQDREMVEFLDGDTEISPGVFCEMIDGYSQGHQIIKVNAGSERIVYLSELIPAPSHLPLAYITAYDRYPDQTLEIKRRIIAQCEQEGWLMVFAHGYKEYAGYIKRNNTSLNLEPISI